MASPAFWRLRARLDPAWLPLQGKTAAQLLSGYFKHVANCRVQLRVRAKILALGCIGLLHELMGVASPAAFITATRCSA